MSLLIPLPTPPPLHSFLLLLPLLLLLLLHLLLFLPCHFLLPSPALSPLSLHPLSSYKNSSFYISCSSSLTLSSSSFSSTSSLPLSSYTLLLSPLHFTVPSPSLSFPFPAIPYLPFPPLLQTFVPLFQPSHSFPIRSLMKKQLAK